MALIISAPWDGPAHRNLSDPCKMGFDFGWFFVAFVHNCAQPRVTCGVISGNDEKATKNGQKSCKNDEKPFGGDKNLPRPLRTS